MGDRAPGVFRSGISPEALPCSSSLLPECGSDIQMCASVHKGELWALDEEADSRRVRPASFVADLGRI